ncbi:hypothetical protein EVAR_91047_1 [Eumeta japonica]|uniref:Uncharacterized protein n=1 Tax=Eumeta variegata TaxID=151549 RepID=A0A4C1Z8E0_EUMVA|nr:hypothetical protein EVAR_91047_1 [Eumeta japonica]
MILIPFFIYIERLKQPSRKPDIGKGSPKSSMTNVVYDICCDDVASITTSCLRRKYLKGTSVGSQSGDLASGQDAYAGLNRRGTGRKTQVAGSDIKLMR